MEKPHRELLEYEIRWLRSRGGRTEMDVLWDETGYPYVLMGNGKGSDMMVYIPAKEVIISEFKHTKYEF